MTDLNRSLIELIDSRAFPEHDDGEADRVVSMEWVREAIAKYQQSEISLGFEGQELVETLIDEFAPTYATHTIFTGDIRKIVERTMLACSLTKPEPVSSAPECECYEISNGETCVKCGPSSEQPDDCRDAFEEWVANQYGESITDGQFVDLLLAWEAAMATKRESGWLPIEIAPKDGKPLLLCDLDEPVIIVGVWKDGEWRCQWDEEPIRGFTLEFWMPLPKLPEITNTDIEDEASS